MNYKNAYGEEKVYQFNEYILSYDKSERNRSCLTISKTQNGNIYVMSELLDGSADVVSMILDSLQTTVNYCKQENKILRENEEHNDKVVDKVNWENQELKKQLEYLRSGEYYNQLRFERDMLQYVTDNGKVSKEDKEFIDMTHRNTELLEVIEEVKRVLRCNNIEVLKYYDEPSETGSYEIVTVDLLQILDKVTN